MNLKQLDLALRQLSPSEIGYKNGTKPPFWSPEVLSGKIVPCIHIPDAATTHNAPEGPFHLTFPELNISLNRSSRYSEVPLHTHDFAEISYMYSGSCSETIQQTDLTLSAGQVLILDTNTPHLVSLLEENDILINLLVSKTYLHNTLFRHLSHNSVLSDFFINMLTEKHTQNNYLLFHSEDSERIPLFFGELLCECCDPSINSTDIITSLITLIVVELVNIYEKEQAKLQLQSDNISFIPILHYLETNFRTCSRKSVADIFHVSEKHLTNLIKKNTGMSYKQLIQTQKLRYAAKLLKNTRLPISDVIVECGYENANFFYQKFNEKYGVNPKEYRKNCQEI